MAQPTPSVQSLRECIVCGKDVTRNMFPVRRAKAWLWCSTDCWKHKPRKVISIEIMFGVGSTRRSIEDILVDTARQYGTINSHASALGISPPYLYTMIRKYFRLPAEDGVGDRPDGTRAYTMREFLAEYAPHRLKPVRRSREGHHERADRVAVRPSGSLYPG